MLTMNGMTDIGQRQHNEDYYLVDPGLNLAIVADGMGGYSAGDVASRVACETIRENIAAGTMLREALSRAHITVKRVAAEQYGGARMGCAIIAALFQGHDYQICWVGDCRAYVWADSLIQVTRDHTYVESLLSQGLISLAEADSRSDRNLIMQAVGASEEELDISSVRGTLTRGEEILLCSDGLNHVLTGQTMAAILNNGNENPQRCHKLITTAVAAGADDNVTAVLISPIETLPEGPRHRPATVSIAGLDGSVEYFRPPEVTSAVKLQSPPEQTTPPNRDEELTPEDITISKATVDDRPRSTPLGLDFVRYILIGLVAAGAIIALLLFGRLLA